MRTGSCRTDGTTRRRRTERSDRAPRSAAGQTISRSRAIIAAWVRLRAPSLRMIARTCIFTVTSLDVEPVGDFLVLETVADPVQHLQFAVGERGGRVEGFELDRAAEDGEPLAVFEEGEGGLEGLGCRGRRAEPRSRPPTARGGPCPGRRGRRPPRAACRPAATGPAAPRGCRRGLACRSRAGRCPQPPATAKWPRRDR